MTITDKQSQHLGQSDLANRIDHTLLKPEATLLDLRTLCAEARAHGFATVCVSPWMVPAAVAELKESKTKVITVVGFPLGTQTSESKAFETKLAVSQGAQEIDMVVNLGGLKAGDEQLVLNDIKAVVAAATPLPVKVILETAALTDAEKRLGATLSKQAGAAFVKTSTGFHAKGGATEYDVRLLRETVGPTMGVKASGGIRSREDALKMIAAGANRLGTSQSVAIVSGGSQKNEGSY